MAKEPHNLGGKPCVVLPLLMFLAYVEGGA